MHCDVKNQSLVPLRLPDDHRLEMAMSAIFASIGIEQNWHIAQAEGLWGYRTSNAAGVKHTAELQVDDYIVFYWGSRGLGHLAKLHC